MKKLTLSVLSLFVGLSMYAAGPLAVYSFTNDVAGAGATTPPATGITIVSGNTGTAGVISFTDSSTPATTSNGLRIFSPGDVSNTGVADLTLFPTNGTDATVIWKMILTQDTEAKVGVLLRGTTQSSAYATGMMQGYVALAWYKDGALKGRVYKSASTLTAIDGGYGSGNSFTPQIGIPVWIKVSVVGSAAPVTLNVSCSSDMVSWTPLQTDIQDTGSTDVYTTGASQLIWGIGPGTNDYVLDDIMYYQGTNTATPSLYMNTNVVSEDYYTLTGEQVTAQKGELKGMYIVKQTMSDGSLKTLKVILNK